jgi:hypothetical protein
LLDSGSRCLCVGQAPLSGDALPLGYLILLGAAPLDNGWRGRRSRGLEFPLARLDGAPDSSLEIMREVCWGIPLAWFRVNRSKHVSEPPDQIAAKESSCPHV